MGSRGFRLVDSSSSESFLSISNQPSEVLITSDSSNMSAQGSAFRGFTAKMVDPPTFDGDNKMFDAWILQV